MQPEQNDGTLFVQATLKVLGGKWKLKDSAKRYSELKRLMPEITEKMMIQQLRELERDEIISRRTLADMPPKVEYAFTDYGRTLMPIFKPLCEWGQEHLKRMSTD
jgi:DNA-binding HxlR family transcriptional regulator